MEGGGGSNEDDLTIKLQEIVSVNASLAQVLEKGGAGKMVMEAWDHLQVAVGAYINGEMPGLPPTVRAKRPIRGLAQRLKGKQGRFRGNLSGKRVDFSGRTVISPDPNLPIYAVGVPVKVAEILTFPERVSATNIHRLKQAVQNGPHHPGANNVRLGPNVVLNLAYVSDRARVAEQLKIGDIVERHLMDGDAVLFNRQPSLHKMSIMCHRAVVLPGRTFRFNECVCTPYNADFDGDEMNLHLPQTEEARAEAALLMDVRENLITSRSGEPLVAATQDFLTAAFLLTQRDCFLDRDQFCQVAAALGDGAEEVEIPEPAVLKPVPLWTGKQVINLLLQPNGCVLPCVRGCAWSAFCVAVYSRGRPVPRPLPSGRFRFRRSAAHNVVFVHGRLPSASNRFTRHFCVCSTIKLRVSFELPARNDTGVQPPFRCMCPEDGYVVFRGGVLMCGNLDKSCLGGGSKRGLVYVLARDNNPRTAARALHRLTKMCTRWLTNFGFSIGIEDVAPSPALALRKRELIAAVYGNCDDLIRQFNDGKLPLQAGCNEEQSLESVMNGALSRLRDDAGKLCTRDMHRYNPARVMATCGSKGSELNIAQMVACVGQQNVGGARIAEGFVDRTLPAFPAKAKDPAAKGFVANSFYSGLTATEFFFHTMGGREGLVDTAVKSVTGDTPVVVWEAGRTRYTRIGDWIDAQLAARAADVEHHVQRDMELLHLDTDARQGGSRRATFIPTTDDEGRVSWGRVAAITRHDPGAELYEIMTAAGKRVVVTESKSLIVWRAAQRRFVEVPTPTVKVGDCVPVTAALPQPPALVDHVDMTEYLPKDRCVYGAGFNMAHRMHAAASTASSRCPLEWWDAHNGVACTLPCEHIPAVSHPLSRLHVHLSDECVSELHAARPCGCLPARLPLDRDTGMFIGLYLASGATDAAGATVSIVANDLCVRAFLRRWYDARRIAHRSASQVNRTSGLITTVKGSSRMLAMFLDAFVGQLPAGKHVPDVAFCAPLPFVEGLLSGYVTCNGTITGTSVTMSSPSARLTDGIAMLASRLGVFGQVSASASVFSKAGAPVVAPLHWLRVRGPWAARLAATLRLLDAAKDSQLRALSQSANPSSGLRGFQQHNDVVLDPIVAITALDAAAHPKVYDLTVPNTLNFGLANGLQVRDTAETGYMQRRMMKALEDLSVQYDSTVRTSSGDIVQFVYGQDGLDPAYMEANKQPIDFDRLMDNAAVSVTSAAAAAARRQLEASATSSMASSDSGAGTGAGAAAAGRSRAGAGAGAAAGARRGGQRAAAPASATEAATMPPVAAAPRLGGARSSASMTVSSADALAAVAAGEPDLSPSELRSLIEAELRKPRFSRFNNQDNNGGFMFYKRLQEFFTKTASSLEARMRAVGLVEPAAPAAAALPSAAAASASASSPSLAGGAGAAAAAAAVSAAPKWVPFNTTLLVDRAAASKWAAGKAGSKAALLEQEGAAVVHHTARVTRSIVLAALDGALAKYQRAQIQPGEAVGAVGAHSLGEPATQMTLKTFHFAGVASMNVTLGVPRIKEIMNASRAISTPIIEAALENSASEVAARVVKARMEKTTLGDVAEYIKEVYNGTGAHIAVKLDRRTIQALHLESVTVQSVRDAILSAPKLKMKADCVSFSDEPDVLLVAPPKRLAAARQRAKREREKEKQREAERAAAALEGAPGSGAAGGAGDGDEGDEGMEEQAAAGGAAARLGNRLRTTSAGGESEEEGMDESESDEELLPQGGHGNFLALVGAQEREDTYFSLQTLKAMLPGVIVQGIPSVARAVITFETASAGPNAGKREYKLLVEGYNLLRVMGTPGVRAAATKSNHVIEMETALGIEAARSMIMVELARTYGTYGINIDQRHLQLLADVMTYRGAVLGITRFGIAKMKDSVLMLASFEKTPDHLFDAAVHSRVDYVRGVSESIIVGTPVPLGTGLFTVQQQLAGVAGSAAAAPAVGAAAAPAAAGASLSAAGLVKPNTITTGPPLILQHAAAHVMDAE